MTVLSLKVRSGRAYALLTGATGEGPGAHPKRDANRRPAPRRSGLRGPRQGAPGPRQAARSAGAQVPPPGRRLQPSRCPAPSASARAGDPVLCFVLKAFPAPVLLKA